MELQQTGLCQRGGDVTGGDALRKSVNQGGPAHARLAHDQRMTPVPSLENAEQQHGLLVPQQRRIQKATARLLDDVPDGGGGLGWVVRDRTRSRLVENRKMGTQGTRCDAMGGEQLPRDSAVLPRQRVEQVADGHLCTCLQCALLLRARQQIEHGSGEVGRV